MTLADIIGGRVLAIARSIQELTVFPGWTSPFSNPLGDVCFARCPYLTFWLAGCRFARFPRRKPGVDGTIVASDCLPAKSMP